MRYFLLPRQTDPDAPWILCFACDRSAYPGAQVVWEDSERRARDPEATVVTVRALAGLAALNVAYAVVGPRAPLGRSARFARGAAVLRLAGLGYLLGLAAFGVALDDAPRRGRPVRRGRRSCVSLVALGGGRRCRRPVAAGRRFERGLPHVRAAPSPCSSRRRASRWRGSSSRRSSARRGCRACRRTTRGRSGCRRARRSTSSAVSTSTSSRPRRTRRTRRCSPILDAAAFHAMGGADVVTLHVQFWFLVVGAVAAAAGLPPSPRARRGCSGRRSLLVLVVPRFGERLLAPAGRRPRSTSSSSSPRCCSRSGSATGAAGASPPPRCCSPARAEHEARGASSSRRRVLARRVRRLAARAGWPRLAAASLAVGRRRASRGGSGTGRHDIRAGRRRAFGTGARSRGALARSRSTSSTRTRAGRSLPVVAHDRARRRALVWGDRRLAAYVAAPRPPALRRRRLVDVSASRSSRSPPTSAGTRSCGTRGRSSSSQPSPCRCSSPRSGEAAGGAVDPRLASAWPPRRSSPSRSSAIPLVRRRGRRALPLAPTTASGSAPPGSTEPLDLVFGRRDTPGRGRAPARARPGRRLRRRRGAAGGVRAVEGPVRRDRPRTRRARARSPRHAARASTRGSRSSRRAEPLRFAAVTTIALDRPRAVAERAPVRRGPLLRDRLHGHVREAPVGGRGDAVASPTS